MNINGVVFFFAMSLLVACMSPYQQGSVVLPLPAPYSTPNTARTVEPAHAPVANSDDDLDEEERAYAAAHPRVATPAPQLTAAQRLQQQCEHDRDSIYNGGANSVCDVDGMYAEEQRRRAAEDNNGPSGTNTPPAVAETPDPIHRPASSLERSFQRMVRTLSGTHHTRNTAHHHNRHARRDRRHHR